MKKETGKSIVFESAEVPKEKEHGTNVLNFEEEKEKIRMAIEKNVQRLVQDCLKKMKHEIESKYIAPVQDSDHAQTVRLGHQAVEESVKDIVMYSMEEILTEDKSLVSLLRLYNNNKVVPELRRRIKEKYRNGNFNTIAYKMEEYLGLFFSYLYQQSLPPLVEYIKNQPK